MKKVQRHITALLILSFLLLPLLSIVVLQTAQYYLKLTVKERMKKENAAIISLPAANVQWEKAGKELLIDGKLFDIESYSVSDGILTAKGYFDHEENGILHFLLSFHKKKYNLLQQFFFLLQCFAFSITLFYFVTLHLKGRKLTSFYSSYLPYPVYLVLGPPPRG